MGLELQEEWGYEMLELWDVRGEETEDGEGISCEE